MSNATLETLEGTPVRLIFDLLTLLDLAHLRLISQKLKNDVDQLNEGFKLKEVDIIHYHSKVTIKARGSTRKFERCFSQRENGEHYMIEFVNALKQIMSFEPSYPIEFGCSAMDLYGETTPVVMNHMANALTESRGVLQCTKLNVAVAQEEDVIRLLNLMDPETIDALSISPSLFHDTFIIRNLCNQPNWSRLRHLFAYRHYFNGENTDLLNFKIAFIIVDEMTVDRLKGLLKTFLATDSTQSRQFMIEYDQFPGLYTLATEFGPIESVIDHQTWKIRSGSHKSRNYIKLQHNYRTLNFTIDPFFSFERLDECFAFDDSDVE